MAAKNKQSKVFIVDDHSIVREGLMRMIEKKRSFSRVRPVG
jgi:DNA-binding NarL/FixJ family response regulator